MKKDDFIAEIGKCELCGSRRNLELHHCIPMVCANEWIDLDVEDNWIVVCGSCHSKLTPKKLLTKYGMSKAKRRNAELERAYSFYKECDSDDGLTAADILDIFYKVYMERGESDGET